MSNSNKKPPKPAEVDWPECQLMLVIEPGPGARERLRSALDHCQATAVLIRPRPEQFLGAGEVKPLVDLAQDHGVAVIVCDDLKLAKTLHADGVQLLSGPDLRDRIADARAVLGAESSIGVDARHSRHEAMEAGEAGADYVAFGIASMGDAGRTKRDDLVAWWAEIFESPCVMLDVEQVAEAAQGDRDGADFVALTLPFTASSDDIAVLVGDVDTALSGGNASRS